MQNRGRSPLLVSRWLMMVSMARAVLPVCRSPMISSRWPRPMGIMESMALMPVCTGCFTGWRSITPGDWPSRTRWRSVTTGPFPSSGRPRGSTTRPISALPTGSCATLPVRRTVSPSLMPVSEPNSTAPTLSSSRLRTMPMMSPGNSSSSPAMASSSPQTRAIPSPTCSTDPRLSISSLVVYCFNSFWMTALTSSGRNDIGTPRTGGARRIPPV